MNIQDYTEAAFRTFSYKKARENPKRDFRIATSPFNMGLVSCGLGLVGETSEVLETVFFSDERFEELGDCQWYACTLRDLLRRLLIGDAPSDLFLNAEYYGEYRQRYPVKDMYSPLLIASKISETIKKIVIHGRHERHRVIKLYALVEYYLEISWSDPMRDMEGTLISNFPFPYVGKQRAGRFPTLAQIRAENIAKLLKRYPNEGS